jgi:hypothetical protein
MHNKTVFNQSQRVANIRNARLYLRLEGVKTILYSALKKTILNV